MENDVFEEKLIRIEKSLDKVLSVLHNIIEAGIAPAGMENEMNNITRAPSLNHLFEADYKIWKRTVSEGRAYNVRKMWDKHCAGQPFVEQPINACTEQGALAFLLDLELGAENQAVVLTIFRKLAKQALKQNFLRYNPFEDVKLPKKRKGARRPKYWTFDELQSIFAQCDREQTDAFGCMYYGAMRSADVRALRWENISLERNTVTFHETKSGRVETVAMLPNLRQILQDRHQREGCPIDGWVFYNGKTGDAFNRTYDWRIDEVLKAAGIDKKGRKLHAFRHAAAVHAASGLWGDKWSKEEVADLLRDSSDAVNVYFDILSSSMQEKAQGVRVDLTPVSDDTPSNVVGLQPAECDLGKEVPHPEETPANSDRVAQLRLAASQLRRQAAELEALALEIEN